MDTRRDDNYQFVEHGSLLDSARELPFTSVIGAGPAGLLFTYLVRISADDAGRAAPLSLYDKRTRYERTHRLRMDPEPYREMADSFNDAGLDRFLRFLEAESYRPAVHRLEQRLLEMVESVGVRKELLGVGKASAQTSPAALRQQLEHAGRLRHDTPWIVVAADGVHSDVRRSLGGSRVREVHQLVARLKLRGTELPTSLPLIRQLKLSKLLGSIVDYRLGADGQAEVDLFLEPSEHAALARLEATPKAPVVLSGSRLREIKAPFFYRIVDYLRSQLVAKPVEVTLWSTFVLEQGHADDVVLHCPHARAQIFLVGDAAISLPFFRGMASLARLSSTLANLHKETLSGAQSIDAMAERYRTAFHEVRLREFAIVNARARLIRGAREFIRLAALAPFPIQTWLLSVEDASPTRWRWSPGVALNLIVATCVAVLAIGAPIVAPLVAATPSERFAIGSGLYAAAGLTAAAGGVLYRHTRNVDPSAASAVRRIWLVQMLVLMVGGAAVTASSWWRDFGAQLVPAIAWFGFGLCFVAGMAAYNRLDRAWWARAEL